MQQPQLPPKKDVCRALLLRGTAFVHLDPRKGGVLVPSRLRLQPQVVLQIGLDMPVPITDLRVDDEGVYGTLAFKGVPFTCYIPWSAVFALVGEDARGMVWPNEMPTEIAAEVERESKKREAKAVSAQVIPLDAARSRKPSRPAGTGGGILREGARPNHLKVVK